MSSYQQHGRQRFKPSFLRRQGKMTKAQKRYFQLYWSRYGLDLKYNTTFSVQSYFGNQNPISLEIGFGQAETLLYRAVREPERNFVGVEVHKPAVASCLGKLAAQGVENVLLLRKDAYLVLLDHLIDSVFDEIWVFFPKPWEEPERRLLRAFLLDCLKPHVQEGSRLYCATDILEYAHYAVRSFEQNPLWTNLSGKGQLGERPSWRQLSKYEAKASAEGRQSVDFCFQYAARLPQRMPRKD